MRIVLLLLGGTIAFFVLLILFLAGMFYLHSKMNSTGLKCKRCGRNVYYNSTNHSPDVELYCACQSSIFIGFDMQLWEENHRWKEVPDGLTS